MKDGYYTSAYGKTIDKTPAEELPYSWDFEELLDEGETIASVELELAEDLDLIGVVGHDAKHVTAQLGGGVVDKHLCANCVITTSAGNVFARAIWLFIVQTR